MNKVYIVGAGPGDPELLTVKAYKLIQSADIVLHDSLFGEEILNLIPESCQKIYTGKTFNDKQDQAKRQDRINQLLAEGYNANKRVVRLKTGDPLIFGRGIEEIRFLRKNNIEFELVPGVTAGIAAANLLEIPITERSVNTSVIFCTGSSIDNDDEYLKHISYMIKNNTPAIIYMGLKRLDIIIDKMTQNGVSIDTNICAASKISHDDQDIIEGTFKNIIEKLEKHPLKTPTVLLIGDNMKRI